MGVWADVPDGEVGLTCYMYMRTKNIYKKEEDIGIPKHVSIYRTRGSVTIFVHCKLKFRFRCVYFDQTLG